MTALLILGPFICVWAIAVIFYYMGRRRANQVRLAEISFSLSKSYVGNCLEYEAEYLELKRLIISVTLSPTEFFGLKEEKGS